MAELIRAKHNESGNVAEVPDTDFWRDLGWVEVDESTPTTDEIRDLYNPGDYTVDEVAAYLARADDAERQRVIAVEKSAGGRKTILEWTP